MVPGRAPSFLPWPLRNLEENLVGVGLLGGVSHGLLICSCVGLVWPLAPVVALGALGLSSEEAPASRDSLWGQPGIYVCSEKVYLLLGKWKGHINLL